MGDSDEEYDRRRRDKFRGERNDYDNRRPPKGYDRGRGRQDTTWDRGSGKRDYYNSKDNGRERRDSFGRNASPPAKRRREWENNDQQSWKGGNNYQESNVLLPSEKNSSIPSFMSFKEFILQQEDDINETEAVRRYQEYKVEFKRTQINDFFVLHKSEEWFKEKYHPTESVDRKKFIRSSLRKRLRIFLDLWEDGYIDNLSLTIQDSETVLKFIDRVVVKLEGGSEEDVKAIDLPPPEEKNTEVKTDAEPKESTKEEPKDEEPKEPLPPGMEDDDEPLPPGMEDEDEPVKEKEDEAMEESEVKKEGVKIEEDTKENMDEKTAIRKYIYDGLYLKRPLSIFMRTLPANVTKADLEAVCKRYPGFLRVAMSEPSPERRYSRRCWATFESNVNIKDICWNLSNIRVKDIDLTPVVNRDVTNRIRAVNGVTNSPMAMQLDVCYAIKLLKKLDEKHKLYVKDEVKEKTEEVEADAVKKEEEVKEEEDKKSEDGKTTDDKPEDGEEETAAVKVEEKPKIEEEILDIPDSNPILSHLSSEIETMITGIEIEDDEDGKKEYPLVVNGELAKALDLTLLYLRVVHCIDFYNGNEYVHEDEMPLRCGIMHVRSTHMEAHCKKDVFDWYTPNVQKLEHLLKDDEFTTNDEADKLGKKNEETEVENFIKANTQELAKDKWLCPLSGKKFRGPEFIRKHILMKHNDNVDNVKMEVQFFNNYVYDTKRPCFPDPKPRIGAAGSGPVATGGTLSTGRTWGSAPRQPSVVFATQKPSYAGNAYQPSTPQIQSAIAADNYGRVNTYPPKARRGGYHDRRIIKYRDLDAPEESDFF